MIKNIMDAKQTSEISLVFGLYLAHKVGIGDGLFTSEMHWTPR